MAEAGGVNGSLPSSGSSGEWPLWSSALLWTAVTVMSVETIVGNALVLCAYRLDRGLRKQISNRYVVSLAVSDLIIGIEGYPLFTVYVTNGERWTLGPLFCRTWLFLDYTLCLVSIVTVLLITVDRYLSVCHPTHYLRWQSDARAQRTIYASWLLPAVFFGVMIYGWPDEQASTAGVTNVTSTTASSSTSSTQCYAPFLDDPYVNMIMYIVYYWATLVAMLILYKGIHRAARHLEKRGEGRELRKMALLTGQRFGAQIGVTLTLAVCTDDGRTGAGDTTVAPTPTQCNAGRSFNDVADARLRPNDSGYNTTPSPAAAVTTPVAPLAVIDDASFAVTEAATTAHASPVDNALLVQRDEARSEPAVEIGEVTDVRICNSELPTTGVLVPAQAFSASLGSLPKYDDVSHLKMVKPDNEAIVNELLRPLLSDLACTSGSQANSAANNSLAMTIHSTNTKMDKPHESTDTKKPFLRTTVGEAYNQCENNREMLTYADTHVDSADARQSTTTAQSSASGAEIADSLKVQTNYNTFLPKRSSLLPKEPNGAVQQHQTELLARKRGNSYVERSVNLWQRARAHEANKHGGEVRPPTEPSRRVQRTSKAVKTDGKRHDHQRLSWLIGDVSSSSDGEDDVSTTTTAKQKDATNNSSGDGPPMRRETAKTSRGLLEPTSKNEDDVADALFDVPSRTFIDALSPKQNCVVFNDGKVRVAPDESSRSSKSRRRRSAGGVVGVKGSSSSFGGAEAGAPSGRARLLTMLLAPISRLRRRRRRTGAERRARKAFRTITFIVGFFALFWSPYFVVATLYGFCAECVPSPVFIVSYYLCYVNSSGNPFAYALANRQFRAAFLRILAGDLRHV